MAREIKFVARLAFSEDRVEPIYACCSRICAIDETCCMSRQEIDWIRLQDQCERSFFHGFINGFLWCEAKNLTWSWGFIHDAQWSSMSSLCLSLSFIFLQLSALRIQNKDWFCSVKSFKIFSSLCSFEFIPKSRGAFEHYWRSVCKLTQKNNNRIT